MIAIKSLTTDDIGEYVIYRENSPEMERGRIKSWNDRFIFVVFKCNNEWDRFKDFTGECVCPEDLTFS